ncbi:MAG TPA: virulence protein RhuM/Fic/DOC family protein [Salinimicrobium sp.]|nr:virulence protein RhuM/Fic/DOC family protein [Salinimicrobium sp.]
MNELIVYQTKEGAIELKADLKNETIWANRMQMAEVFEVNPQAISKHVLNIYKDGELEKKATSSKMELVQNESGRTVKRLVDYYNLEMIISIGYRINSVKGTKFRQWATKTLKQHITQGFTINHNRIKQTKAHFLQTLEDLKQLVDKNQLIEAKDVLTLVQSFSNTWFSLDSYDKNEFPTKGTQMEIQLTAKELSTDLQNLKQELIKKGEATELFAQEKNKGNLAGIFGSVFQSVFGEDAYKSIEEKAAHLLYFIVKNHPFNDGNKRSGAFAFIWFLQKAGYDFREKITPETLTALTLLIAESNPNEKDKMTGVVLLLLNKEQ